MKAILICSALLTGLLGSPSLFAQPFPETGITPEKLQHRLKDLREAEIEAAAAHAAYERNDPDAFDAFSGAYQSLATEQAFSGQSDQAIATFDTYWRGRESAAGSQIVNYFSGFEQQIADAAAKDALREIVSAAKNRRVVILNEMHHVPQHRAFAMLVARELKKIGFGYMACETFTGDSVSPLRQRYVDKSTGFYSVEPTYANFLLDALRSDWKFVSYEPSSNSTNGSLRESGMAKNLARQVLRPNKDAKLFIYVGYSHLLKVPASTTDEDSSRLAAQIVRLTGIVPLSIDQTMMFNHYASRQQQAAYRQALLKSPGGQPFVLKSKSQGYVNFGFEPGAIDLQVIHPDYGVDSTTGRPAWLVSLGNLKPYQVPASYFPTRGRRMLYAYRKDDPDGAMPVDVLIVEKRGNDYFMLPDGKFRFTYEDEI